MKGNEEALAGAARAIGRSQAGVVVAPAFVLIKIDYEDLITLL